MRRFHISLFCFRAPRKYLKLMEFQTAAEDRGDLECQLGPGLNPPNFCGSVWDSHVSENGMYLPSYGIFFSSRKWWPSGFQGFPPPQKSEKAMFFWTPSTSSRTDMLSTTRRWPGTGIDTGKPYIGGKNAMASGQDFCLNQSIEHWEVKYPSVHGKIAIL